MEQNHTSGFDYGRVRDKMLKSWGRKPTEKEAPRREKQQGSRKIKRHPLKNRRNLLK